MHYNAAQMKYLELVVLVVLKEEELQGGLAESECFLEVGNGINERGAVVLGVCSRVLLSVVVIIVDTLCYGWKLMVRKDTVRA